MGKLGNVLAVVVVNHTRGWCRMGSNGRKTRTEMPHLTIARSRTMADGNFVNIRISAGGMTQSTTDREPWHRPFRYLSTPHILPSSSTDGTTTHVTQPSERLTPVKLLTPKTSGWKQDQHTTEVLYLLKEESQL